MSDEGRGEVGDTDEDAGVAADRGGEDSAPPRADVPAQPVFAGAAAEAPKEPPKAAGQTVVAGPASEPHAGKGVSPTLPDESETAAPPASTASITLPEVVEVPRRPRRRGGSGSNASLIAGIVVVIGLGGA